MKAAVIEHCWQASAADQIERCGIVEVTGSFCWNPPSARMTFPFDNAAYFGRNALSGGSCLETARFQT